MKTLENPDVPHKDNANARNTLLRALLDVLIASEEYTHVFLYFDDVRFGPEGAGEDLPTLWTEALIACSQLTARVLVSSFSNAPQSWRDDTAQKVWSEKIDLNGIGHGFTKDDAETLLLHCSRLPAHAMIVNPDKDDEATKLQRWKWTYKDTIAVDAMQND